MVNYSLVQFLWKEIEQSHEVDYLRELTTSLMFPSFITPSLTLQGACEEKDNLYFD